MQSSVVTADSLLTVARGRGARTPPPIDRGGTVSVATELEAAPERVFDAWLDPRIAGKWLFATASRPPVRVTIDPRVGGAFRFLERDRGDLVEHAGVYVEIVRPRRLVFTLGGAGRSRGVARVSVEIGPRASGSRLTVLLDDVPPDRADGIEARWTGMLYGLGVTLSA